MNAVVNILAVLAVTLCLVPESDSLTKYCLEGKHPDPSGYCGFRLRDIIEAVCRMFHMKDPFAIFEKRLRNRSIREVRLRKAKALSFLRHTRSRLYEQGIICECCFHHCSVEELREYCV